MDCPSEENLMRLKLDDLPEIVRLDFDLPNRRLTVLHTGKSAKIESALACLKLGATLIETERSDEPDLVEPTTQRKLLWSVLAINLAFFVIEISTGLLSRSMGLVADSLDMLADSIVYGISLLAVGGTLARKKKAARVAGYFQVTLAIIGFVEVIRRFVLVEEVPDFTTMIVVSILALTANGICLYLLQGSKSNEAHMRASMIFTSNDVIINFGVIVAGLLVNWLDSNKPDLIIGAVVFLLVIHGAIRILKLGR